MRPVWPGPPNADPYCLFLMDGWVWSDPRWQERVGSDAEATLREALRRAVDLRDSLAHSGRDETTRAVFLVSVLNHLTELLQFDATPVVEDL